MEERAVPKTAVHWTPEGKKTTGRAKENLEKDGKN